MVQVVINEAGQMRSQPSAYILFIFFYLFLFLFLYYSKVLEAVHRMIAICACFWASQDIRYGYSTTQSSRVRNLIDNDNEQSDSRKEQHGT